jgi:hypothetical protein
MDEIYSLTFQVRFFLRYSSSLSLIDPLKTAATDSTGSIWIIFPDLKRKNPATHRIIRIKAIRKNRLRIV